MQYTTPSEQDEIRREMQQIKESQKKTLAKQLRANRNKVFSINSVRTLQSQIDSLAAKVISQPTTKIDCKPGCSHCCNMRVEVIAPEVFLIARHLKEQLSTNELTVLVGQLRAHAQAADGVHMERFSLQCLLLKNGLCSVYSVRPTMCRKFLSLDVEACKVDSARAVAGESRGYVPEDQEMSLKSAAYSGGLFDAYKVAQLPVSFHELGQSLLIALTDETAEDRWFKKQEVFPIIPEQIEHRQST